MIICGTGHRPDKLGGYGIEVHENLVLVAKQAIKGMQPSKVISGMALGWDQALMEAAQLLAYPTVAAIPFKGQQNAWPEASRSKYAALLNEATEVVYVCPDGYAPWKMQKRNQWMVDNAHVVLALWNGSQGGTANCVKYANLMRKPVVNVWDNYDRLQRETGRG